MDFWQNVVLGFSVVSEPINLLFCFIGVFLGTLIGVLPGLGPAATIALLLPVTYHLPPVSSIIMICGIFYGAKYGGSTTAILLCIPGEADAVITCLDGHQMARAGRAGPALGIAAFGSFIAGTIGTAGLMLMAPMLSDFALRFGPPEIFDLMLLSLVLLVFLASGSPIKAFMMAATGIFLGTIGTDLFTPTFKFTFGIDTLDDGIGVVPVVMGLFGLAEVLDNVEKGLKREIFKAHIANLFPTLKDWKDSIGAIFRGTFIGYFVGLLPGGGPVLSTFTSYGLEKRLSKHPEKFGTGIIEGVAGPESANNANASASFVPLMTLGIPTHTQMAIIYAALLINGLQPGPMLIKNDPSFFWGVIASMYLGNVMLVALNLPLIGLWVRFLRIPYSVLFPSILFFLVLGSYTISNNIIHVFIMILFGVFGFLMRKFKYEPAPLIMGFVLSRIIEGALVRSLLMSHGSPSIFFRNPICITLIGMSLVLLISSFLRKRKNISRSGDDE